MLDRTKPVAAAILLAATFTFGGCAGTGGLSLDAATGMPTGNIAANAKSPAGTDAAKTEAGAQAVAAAAAAPAAKSPAATALPSLALARALRDKGEKTKALAELERGRLEKPGDRELAREAGIMALELGQLDKARKSLTAALDSAQPDFHTLSALATVHASSGNQREAQAHFNLALKLKPGHRPTLNNLALSYALEGDLAKAESTLKSASRGAETPQQVKENLALILALAGKFDDAEKIAAGVMPKAKAAANMAYLRSLTEKEKGG